MTGSDAVTGSASAQSTDSPSSRAAFTSCTWAACTQPAVRTVDGWAMCAPHEALHYQLEAPDHPARRAPCGTESAYRRHLHHGEVVCVKCRCAAARERYEREEGKRRADYGKRRDVDAPARRCVGCGEWLWARSTCGVCVERKAS